MVAFDDLRTCANRFERAQDLTCFHVIRKNWTFKNFGRAFGASAAHSFVFDAVETGSFAYLLSLVITPHTSRNYFSQKSLSAFSAKLGSQLRLQWHIGRAGRLSPGLKGSRGCEVEHQAAHILQILKGSVLLAAQHEELQ